MAYTVTLQLPTTEVFGPKTNQKTIGILNPDAFQTNGAALRAVRPRDMFAWLPNLLRNNVYQRNGGTFVDSDALSSAYLTSEYPAGSSNAASIT